MVKYEQIFSSRRHGFVYSIFGYAFTNINRITFRVVFNFRFSKIIKKTEVESNNQIHPGLYPYYFRNRPAYMAVAYWSMDLSVLTAVSFKQHFNFTISCIADNKELSTF